MLLSKLRETNTIALISTFRYPALRWFLEKYNFPMGTLNLRKFDWNLKFFYAIGSHKMKTISEIIDAYPSRKYIFVGDSGLLFDLIRFK